MVEDKSDLLVTRQIPNLPHTSIISSVSIHILKFWSWETCYVFTVSNMKLADNALFVTVVYIYDEQAVR